ncbi:hypothetical protein DNTS_033441 [Danionella cerebrum]|uniref:C2H2-type domain-containing protein n=1 Tax=Danionella cerebrum TaxID=2873325 RepID=A0A553Q6F6_9TELE|nr:hypothetical protein DNTS_033441 [Danionella translucida]
MSREEEIITLQQFLRFGETKSIVELMAIQEKEGQAVTVPSSKTDSGIRTFIESNNRTRSPGLLSHLENNSPSSIHHFENIPNSLAFLLPFQYINPMSAPMLGLPPNGLTLEQSGHRMREPNLPSQSEPVDASESEVSLSPFHSSQSPSQGAMGTLPNAIEPKTEPNRASPISPTPSIQLSQHRQTPTQQLQVQQQQQSSNLSNHQMHHHFDKSEQSKTITHSSFSSKMHRMRRMGATSRKGRVCCNSCGKTFYDKGTLKIHYNAVHLKIKHRCTIEGCNMVFSSLRSRNRHSANPNPRLHMPMLRNNRDKDLIRSSSGTATPVITKSGFNLTSPGRPPLSFATPPLEPMIQSPLQSPMIFPSLKSVQPVQPVPPFYRSLLSPADLVSPPVSLPTSPIMPTTTNSTSATDQHQMLATNMLASDTAFSHRLSTTLSNQESMAIDPMPKKKPRKSSMPVKIEKEVIDVADDYDDKDDDDDDGDSCHHGHHQQSSIHSNHNGNCNNNGSSSSSHHCGGSGHESHDEMSPSRALKGMLHPDQEECTASHDGRNRGDLRCIDSFTSEDQDHERDFENDSETSESKMLYRDELMEADIHQTSLAKNMEQEHHGAEDDSHLQHLDEQSHSPPSQHQPVIKIKEEINDPTYDMFCMGQYSLYNGGMAAAAAAASMAALHESFLSSMSYGTSPPKYPSQSPEGDLCSSPDPKICYVCKKSFKSSYSVKLHYKNVHLKEMHVCTVSGCNAAFPSRRSRDRHSSNINLHRKLLTKELDDIVLDPQLTTLPKELRAEFLSKMYSEHQLGVDRRPPQARGHEGMRSLLAREYSLSNGYCHGPNDDYVVLDLSTASSIQSSGSVQSSHESDDGSDEGILLDDLEDVSDSEYCSPATETQRLLTEGTDEDKTRQEEGGSEERLLHCHPSISPSDLASSGGTGTGGILCTICHKIYSNKGTLRVHYKTVHLREMHKCKIPGCNMMFSSVRSRNRHSQNPNLHKNAPYDTID